MFDKEFCLLLIRAALMLTATFLGAWFAYQFQNRREKIKDEKSRKGSLNKALFTLLRMYNALTFFKNELHLLENDESRAFKLRPWKTNDYEDLKFDVDALGFLIETEKPDLLFQLLIEQEKFEQAINSINTRSKYQVDVIQPLLEKSGIANQKLPYEIFSNSIGKEKLEGLIVGTDEVYSHVYESYASTEIMLSQLYNFAKKLFPKEKFIRVENST